jgi:hypothetical protein
MSERDEWVLSLISLLFFVELVIIKVYFIQINNNKLNKNRGIPA